MANYGDKVKYFATVANLSENGVTLTMVMNLEDIKDENGNVTAGVVGMNKDFSEEELHTYIHIGVQKLLSQLTSKVGRYLKFKCGNAPHKYEGVTSLLCLLMEGAGVELEREFVQKGTDLNGVAAKADLWRTSDLKVTFKPMTAEDNELANMLLADVKPRQTVEIKPLF